ncbi:MAG: c-type cytochrome [Proteobacteria bacterium]|nr:c-type cytochrome [Pseudomonadota bacterium]
MILLPAAAGAQDVERGHQLAERWCSGCHTVERSPAAARADGIPSFAAIAGISGNSTDRLRAAMNPTHGRMPDLSLSKRDQDDLAAYILSLRRN